MRQRFCLNLCRLASMGGIATTFYGCAAPRPSTTMMPRQGEVYCIRGLMDVFSLGMNTLADELRARGVEAYAVSGPSWPAMAHQLGDLYEHDKNPPPIVLVGHSYGADDAVRASRYLDQRGVRVRLLVLLDATIPPEIPQNVDRVVHFYRETLAGDLLPFVFAGNPVTPSQGNDRTQIVNSDLGKEKQEGGIESVNHFNIDKSNSILERVVREVLAVCPERHETVVQHASSVESATLSNVR